MPSYARWRILRRFPVPSEAEYKNHACIGRNFAIELLEFFDRSGFTERLGDRRRVRRPAADTFGTEDTEGAENDTNA